MRNRASYRSTAGFTLIEMLTVLMIASILALIAAPGWLSFMNSRRAEAGRDQLLQFLRQAQSQALKTRQAQAIEFQSPTNELPIVKIAGVAQPLDGQMTANQLTTKSMGLEVIAGDGSSDTTCPGADPCIVFDDRGNVALGTGTKLIVTSPAGNEGSKRCVIVETLLGAMRTASRDECQ